MSARRHDPLRLDVSTLASHGDELAGQWSLAELGRLQQTQTAPQDWVDTPVTWSARGERRVVTGDPPQVWLLLQARATVWLTCQRCLQPFMIDMAVDRWFRFVRGEDQAETLDAESEDDVLALTRSLDLKTLVEDELLLALPIVPRHEVCPQFSGRPEAAVTAAPPARENPFSALATLKSRSPRG